MKSAEPKTYAFIDASNIIYGTRDEGWKVDFKKLFKYLKQRYKCRIIYYFAGKDEKNLKQDNFYKKLKQFGYQLVLRKVKLFHQNSGHIVKKANCDVDLTFYVMKDKDHFKRMILFSGDGDFDILLKFLISVDKQIIVFANSKRTAHEIKELKSIQFNNLEVLKNIIQWKP